MKNQGFGSYLLLVALIVSTASSALAQGVVADEAGKPAVVKAVAPSAYPPVAKAARAGGKVTVRVMIDEAGKVAAASFNSGHPLLNKVSLEAARKWIFAAALKKDGERFVDLEFIYTEAGLEEEAGLFFAPPYRVEIVIAAPIINNSSR